MLYQEISKGGFLTNLKLRPTNSVEKASKLFMDTLRNCQTIRILNLM
jgi:hypothetical protein